MKKVLVIIITTMLIGMVSCSSIKRESIGFERINSEVKSCVPADDGHYEVTLILENGKEFVYHSPDDVNLIDEEILISMGYDRESKKHLSAVINPKD